MQILSIESVEASYNQWRQKRSNRIEPIPLKLWAMAIALYPRYKQSHICQRLHLNGGQFKKKLEASFNPVGIEDGFVTATPQMPRTPQETREATLSLRSRDRTLSLSFSILDLPKVLPSFEALL